MSVQNKEFKKLQKQWYKKLKASGFDDIENGKEDGTIHRYSPGSDSSLRDAIKYEVVKEYYYKATHFLTEYKFPDELSRFIWEHHSNGVGIRKIASLLKSNGHKALKKSQVAVLLKELRQEMKILYKNE